MKKDAFKVLAKLNKRILPSYTKRKLNIGEASKIQLTIIAYRAYVTKQALG